MTDAKMAAANTHRRSRLVQSTVPRDDRMTCSSHGLALGLIKTRCLREAAQDPEPPARGSPRDLAIGIDAGEMMVRCGPCPTGGPRGPLDRVAQMADRKYCRSHAQPFRLGFPRKVPVFPICPPAAL